MELRESAHEQGSRDIFGADAAIAMLRRNDIRTAAPPLAGYLEPGMSVLDLGCGPGSVTCDVASRIGAGRVFGLDLEQSSAVAARELARSMGLDNARFDAGDAHELKLEDETFDLVYSVFMLEWARDPAKVLREKIRVARHGGRVLACIGDWGSRVLYPRCPAVEEVWRALPALALDPSKDTFFNPHLGRGAFELFQTSGLKSVAVTGYAVPRGCVRAGDANLFDSYMLFKYTLMTEGGFGARLRHLIDIGALDQKLLTQANREIDAWLSHPGAFHMASAVLVTGTRA